MDTMIEYSNAIVHAFQKFRVLPQFYVFHSNQVIRMPINAGFLILVNDKIRMFAEEPKIVHIFPEQSAVI